MRITLASRIFEPEPAAASFRLSVLADELCNAGHEVRVLTVRPPASLVGAVSDTSKRYRVERFPVIRDRAGYVRGYVQYLSFDLPLFFRILLGPRADLIVVEPPPTTGFFVRCAAALRRTPYAYYAADIWSEASVQTTAPRWVVRVVRKVERFALQGARVILSVSSEVTSLIRSMGVRNRVFTIGNGVDAGLFRRGLAERVEVLEGPVTPVFVYAGTASEWHGAEVFIEALPTVLEAVPEVLLRFIGGGSEWEALKTRAKELGVAHAVSFERTLPPASVAPILRGATAAVASVRPRSSYEFAFPTKLYSAAVCGAPIIYVGKGPTREFVATEVDGAPLGISVDSDAREVAQAMIDCVEAPWSSERRSTVSAWAADNVSLQAVSRRAVACLEGVMTKNRGEAR